MLASAESRAGVSQWFTLGRQELCRVRDCIVQPGPGRLLVRGEDASCTRPGQVTAKDFVELARLKEDEEARQGTPGNAREGAASWPRDAENREIPGREDGLDAHPRASARLEDSALAWTLPASSKVAGGWQRWRVALLYAKRQLARGDAVHYVHVVRRRAAGERFEGNLPGEQEHLAGRYFATVASAHHGGTPGRIEVEAGRIAADAVAEPFNTGENFDCQLRGQR